MPITISRRTVIQSLAAMAPASLMSRLAGQKLEDALSGRAQDPYPRDKLPEGVRSRFVDGINGLRMHVLEAGYEKPNRPGVLLLHGFPELAYSWRRILVHLAESGFHAFAPDQRGYGRTTGWANDYDADIAPWRQLNLVRDALGLVMAMGYGSVSVVGHDFGSPVAAWSAATRPDVFTKVVLMSAPFAGTGSLPFNTVNRPPQPPEPRYDLHAEFAKLPRPRKHYTRYYRTREANENMWHAPQGLHAFLRGYYHYKSADWPKNKPFRLASRTAEEMAKMPTYYIMDLADGMAETVAKHMPSSSEIAGNHWLPDDELQVYTEEYQRTGFQGGLNWYRGVGLPSAEKEIFAGRKIEQPSLFISGASDWGSYQAPGRLEQMQTDACTDMRGIHLIKGAGHWVQQEQSKKTAGLLIDFLRI